jgi:hypothetical protein
MRRRRARCKCAGFLAALASRDRAHDGGNDQAALAFVQLGREVSLLRAAIKGLLAAQESADTPNYEPTLARTEKVLSALARQIDAMSRAR